MSFPGEGRSDDAAIAAHGGADLAQARQAADTAYLQAVTAVAQRDVDRQHWDGLRLLPDDLIWLSLPDLVPGSPKRFLDRTGTTTASSGWR